MYCGVLTPWGILQRLHFSASPANINLASALIISLLGVTIRRLPCDKWFRVSWHGVWLQPPPPRAAEPSPSLCSPTPPPQTRATLQRASWHILCLQALPHLSWLFLMHSLGADYFSMPSWLCYGITSPSSPLGISLAPAHCAACLCLQARDFSLLLHLHVLPPQTLMIIDTNSCFFSDGETWNKGKSYYFCTLGVGHALNRPEVNFLHVIFCTAGLCDGWKQHFFVPHLETCSFNYV